MIRRGPALSIALTLILGALVPVSAAAAGPTLPFPDTMAAVGDSITQAGSTGGTLGADAPQNSWSTGTSTTVNSHYLRLVAAGAPVSGRNYNRSVSGAKMANLNGQMQTLAAIQPDYLTVLMGGNDLCTDTVAQMTAVADFRAQLQTGMATLLGTSTTAGLSPNTNVYVVSIPDVYQLWNLFKGNFWARFIWSSAGICQSLLANPTSTQPADVQRRAAVRQRNIDYNTQLAQVCSAFPNCHFDNNAVFNTAFTTSDVSGDYFHPSIAGQAKLASVSWSAGYAWVPTAPQNQPPSASFTDSCEGLACTFTNTSTDADGTMTHAWTFGDGTGSTEVSPSHSYAAAGTYTVRLTATDDDLATDTEERSVIVTAPASNASPTASFTASCSGLTCAFTDTSTDGDGFLVSRSWNFGDGATSTETNPTRTYAAGGTYTVSLTVTDDDGATGSTSQAVSVSSPVAQAMHIESLTATASNVNSRQWRATVTITVRDAAGAAVPNATVGGSWTVGTDGTCTTGPAGTCSVTSDNLNRRNVASVTFTVTGVTRTGFTYDPAANVVTSITVLRP